MHLIQITAIYSYYKQANDVKFLQRLHDQTLQEPNSLQDSYHKKQFRACVRIPICRKKQQKQGWSLKNATCFRKKQNDRSEY